MMEYTITPERLSQLIEIILGPFEIRDKTKDSWKGRFWELGSDDPKRQVVVWDKDGEALFSFDRNRNILTISMNHFDKITSYIPLDEKQLKDILIVLFNNLLDNKYPIEKVEKLNIDWSDKYYLENPLVRGVRTYRPRRDRL